MRIETESVYRYHLTMSEAEFQKMKNVFKWVIKINNSGELDGNLNPGETHTIYQDTNELIEEIRKFGKF